MLYIIKNVSTNNIVIGKISFQPGFEIKSDNLEPFKKMIEKGYLHVKSVTDNNTGIYNDYISKSDNTAMKISVLENQDNFISKESIEKVNISNLSIEEVPKIDVKERYIPESISKEAVKEIIKEVIKEEIPEKKEEKSLLNTEDKFLNQTIKDNLMESFFNFYIDKNVSDKDLRLIKWFYKNIGITNKVSEYTLELLDHSDNYEDFTAVLLNNVYPELLELYLNDKIEKK